MKTKHITILIFLMGIGLLLSHPKPSFAATLSLSPQSVSVEQNQQTNYTLSLDPQGALVIGTDIILTYNPTYVNIVSVVKLQAFSGNPATIIDNTNGITKFSLTQNYGAYLTTPQAVATITVQGLNRVDNTPITMQFTPGKTQDTNVAVSGGRDVLTQVTNASLTVTTPSGNNPTPTPTQAPTPTPTEAVISPSPTPTPTTNPHAVNRAQPTTPPLAPGFVSPLGKELPSNKPTDIPKGGRILGVESTPQANPTSNLSVPFLILSAIIALGLITIFLLVRRLHRTNQPDVSQPPPSSILPKLQPYV